MFKLLFLLLTTIFFIGCDKTTNTIGASLIPSVEGDIVDTIEWYDDANTDITNVYVDVPYPNKLLCSPYTNLIATERPCLLEDIINDRYNDDTYKPVLQVAMYTDTFNVNRNLNAEMKLRGNYSRTLPQKSFAVKLDSKTDLFLKQRKYQFNKHRSDEYRTKAKLAYDMFREIPNFPTIKTQFFRLFIDGEDYGVFTHSETIREEYLVNRGWNVNDRLYSSVLFYWESDDKLKTDKNGKPLDPDGFNGILEIKAGKEHSLVNKMLLAIENTNDIDAVVEKYFNRDNFLTWMAVNLLLSDKDTTYHNYYLYNPLYSETFYFVPWDYDGAWANTSSLSKNEYGLEVWWQSTLHRRFLRIKKNRDDLYAKADELRRTVITDENIIKKLKSYEAVMKEEQGDKWLESAKALAFRAATSTRHELGINRNIFVYQSVIGHPMPFDVTYTYINGILKLSWTISEDLEGDPIVYDVQVSTESSFVGKPLVDMKGITTTSVEVPGLDINQIYFAKVVSRELNDETHWQISHSVYYDSPTAKKYFGVQALDLSIEQD